MSSSTTITLLARTKASASGRPLGGAHVQSESDNSQVIRIDRFGGPVHEYARVA
jgi:hypothetical protein